ncbi:hypothetical protein, partial [Streptomyces sp. NPDC002215]|uniref:hypothetical protein n=1 Tax=Streptomyces sp. NPDC002215 TaxID=3154412 RepID=UPI003326C74F
MPAGPGQHLHDQARLHPCVRLALRRRSPTTAVPLKASPTRAARTGSRRAETLAGPPSSPTART